MVYIIEESWIFWEGALAIYRIENWSTFYYTYHGRHWIAARVEYKVSFYIFLWWKVSPPPPSSPPPPRCVFGVCVESICSKVVPWLAMVSSVNANWKKKCSSQRQFLAQELHIELAITFLKLYSIIITEGNGSVNKKNVVKERHI